MRCEVPANPDIGQNDMDDRKHLTPREVEKLIAATKGARHEARDRCLLLLMFRHGLRVSEALGLELSHVDLEGRTLHVPRLKNGLSTTHPLRTEECRAIRAWLAVRGKMRLEIKALFVSERRGQLSRKTAWLAIRGYGEAAGLEVAAHPTCCATLAASRWPTRARTRA